MSNYDFHQQCHYNDLINFIGDLHAEFGESVIMNILENHQQLSADILDYELDVLEEFNNED